MQDSYASNGTALSPTARVARWSAAHRWVVLAATLLVLVGAVFASATYDVQIDEEGDVGVGDSGKASQILDENFPTGDNGVTEQVLFSNTELTVDNAAYRSTVETLIEELRALPNVVSVSSFYETNDPSLVSDDRHVLRAEIVVDGSVRLNGHGSDRDELADGMLEAVADARNAASDAGYTIAIVGQLATNREVGQMVEEDFGQIMLISLSLGLIIMVLAFRAVVAALVPLTLAVGAIIIATGLAAVVSQSYALNQSYSEMILLLGLAVGIDYSLFIVSRFRKEREAGRPKLEAITVASNTTGRAVVYAGVTVLVSLAGMMLTNLSVFISLAMGAMLVVFVTIVGSITFLPAFLSLLGDKVNWLPVPFLSRAGGNGLWGTITDKVMARPVIFASAALALLLAISVPAASLNLGFPTGSKSLHNDVTAKQAMVLLEDNFTGGLTEPVYVAVLAEDVTSNDVEAAVASLVEDLDAAPESFFGPFEVIPGPDGDLVVVKVPLSGDIDQAEAAVSVLRDELVPAAFAGTTAEVLITGFAAENKDFREYMFERAPYVFAFVLGIAFLLLLVMFRSIVIPVKSILLNMLSVSAAYGVLVMVFQWGWGVEYLGSESSGMILSWLPLFLFAILFGLSMDYHMLLLNRVKESYDETGDNDAAVSNGVRLTAGQITSAAAIMVGVFGAFAMGREVGLQQFGLGLGVAVLIDATVIRSVLLPATMKLLGDWNWYLPNWLEWLPKVSSSEEEVPVSLAEASAI